MTSPTEITAYTPRSPAPGTVDVTVTTPGGTTATGAAPATNPYPCPGSPGGCFAVTSRKQITAFTPQASACWDRRHHRGHPRRDQCDQSGRPLHLYRAGCVHGDDAISNLRHSNVRPHNQCTGKTLGAEGTLTLQVTGEQNALGQTVPTNATGVAVNLTADQQQQRRHVRHRVSRRRLGPARIEHQPQRAQRPGQSRRSCNWARVVR